MVVTHVCLDPNCHLTRAIRDSKELFSHIHHTDLRDLSILKEIVRDETKKKENYCLK